MLYCRRILILSIWAFGAALAILAYKAPFAGLLFGAAVLIAFISSRKKRQQLDSCGTARWATAEDMQAAGMLSGKPGLILGEAILPGGSLPKALKRLFDKRVPDWDACHAFVKSLRKRSREAVPITLSNVCHTIIVAPTGGGKGQCCILPYLKTSPGVTVIIDPKGENYQMTAQVRRQRFGHRIVRLDPFAVCGPGSDTFNPLDAISRDSPLLIDECANLAKAIVLRTGDEKDPYWNNSAELWIKAMCVAVALWGEKDRSLQAVRTLLTDPGKRASIIRMMCESTVLNGMVARLGNQLLNYQQKELGSVLSVVATQMTFLDTPPVAANTQASSFDPSDLNKGKLTVYLVLPPEHIETQSPLMRLWIGSLLKAVVRGGLQEKNKVTFVLDEANTLGKMESIKDALYLYRGYGVRLQLFFQTLAQLRQCWGDGGDQAVLSNCTQVFFAVQEKSTAEYISDRLGEATIIVASGGTNRGESYTTSSPDQGKSVGHNTGINNNWSQQARKLLKPEEIAGLPRRTAITFAPEVPPIISNLTCDYEGEATLRGNAGWSKARVWASALSLLALSLATAALVAVMQVATTR